MKNPYLIAAGVEHRVVLELTDDSGERVAWCRSASAARPIACVLAALHGQPIRGRFIDPRDGDDWTTYPNGSTDRVIGEVGS